MANVTYDEPQKLSDFKPNPFLNIPKSPVSTNTNSSLTVTTRNNDIYAQPHNLPSRQTNLRNDGQWRTINLYPQDRGVDTVYAQRSQRYNANVWTIKNNGTAGLSAGQSYARDEAAAQAAYYLGYFLGGAADGIRNTYRPNPTTGFRRDGLEDLAYNAGSRAGKQLRDLTNDAVNGSRRTVEDLWRNRPTFEIPQIKIPEWDIEFPRIKIPEFELPPFPQPKPIPPPPKLKPKPKPKPNYVGTNCDVSVTIGFYVGQDRADQEYVEEGAGIFAYKYDENVNSPSLYEYPQYNEEPTKRQNIFPDQPTNIAIYRYSGYLINENGQYLGSGAGTLWYTNTSFTKEELTQTEGYIQTDYLPSIKLYGQSSAIKPPWGVIAVNRYNCIQLEPEPPPAPEPPPPPPPEKECCRMSCCPKPTQIDYRIIKRLMVQTIQEQTFTIDIPVVSCEFNQTTNLWEPKTSYAPLQVFATNISQALQQSQLHIENAKQMAELCLARNQTEVEAIASLPLGWQIRNEGNRPQLVIQCAVQERDANNKIKYGSAMYPITVPHWKGGVNDKPSLPVYRKGNHEGILVLADNSKVTVNAANRTECIKIINAIKPWIKKEMLQGSYFKSGDINTDIKVQPVRPMYGRYFSNGQKKSKPDWRVDFP